MINKLKPIQNDLLLLSALFVLAIAIRVPALDQTTGDTDIFVQWYRQMMAAGRWDSLSEQIGNYNAPFVYTMLFASYLPGAIVVKLKIAWLCYDVLLAFFTYKLATLAFPGRWRAPVLAALVMLFVPTVATNASFYGQIDAMWASWAAGGVYFLARGRHWWGVTLCTVSIAFKPQGVYILPLIGLLILAGRIPWRSLLAIPVTYLLLDVPALLAGRDPIELLTIYSLDRQARIIEHVNYGAPSMYAFLRPSADRVDTVKALGYLFCAALVIGIIYVLVARAAALTTERVVMSATLFSLLVPFFLPGMHERYFFLGDVMIVILVFFRPRLWYLAVMEQFASLMVYAPYLFHNNGRPVPLEICATLMLVTIALVAYHLFRDVLTEPRPEADSAQPAPAEETTRIPLPV
ncbi:hypothetical protein AB0C07_25400 [Actinoplanes missouriensis]|uniref:hypothetical protein n=1 Tax=Actinoplanes missouriensis TaxID=1866 RepID=UPI0033EEEDC5